VNDYLSFKFTILAEIKTHPLNFIIDSNCSNPSSLIPTPTTPAALAGMIVMLTLKPADVMNRLNLGTENMSVEVIKATTIEAKRWKH
jgi:hypothetical protein